MMFFTSGGHRGSMPGLFVFAVIFTVLMLDGKWAILLSLAKTAVYTGACVVGYYHSETGDPF